MPSLPESEWPSAGEATQPMSSVLAPTHDFGPPHRLRPSDPDAPAATQAAFPRSSSLTPFPGTPPFQRLPQLPGYEVLGELGRGGMGVVYRARQSKLNRFVALKMLLDAESADLVDVVRFRSEAEAVAAVRHPHVVQVHEFGHFEGKPYLVLEYLPGGSLHTRIRSHAPIAPREAAALVEKLARAVQAAHVQGIVHRDLKPGNVLYDESGEPRITDFGLAKRVSLPITQTQAVMGTPAYMSPEQAHGLTKYVGPPTDIYALGIILYECLTGHPPFAGENSVSVLHQVLNDSPRSIRAQVAAVPRDLELICLKCLEKEAGDRYLSAAALADDLGRYLAGQTVLVRAAGPLERGFKWARRRPTMASVYALSLLVLLVTTVGSGIAGLWREAVGECDRADAHSRVADSAKADAEDQRRDAERARDRLAEQNGEIELSRRSVESSLASEKVANADAQASAKIAREATAKAEAGQVTLEEISYLRNVGFANLETRQGNVLRARQLLDNCPEKRRDWEWWHAYRGAHEDAASGMTNAVASDIAFSGKGVDVTTVDGVGILTPFDMDAGRGVPRPLIAGARAQYFSRLSDDASRVLTVRPGGEKAVDFATVWDAKTGKPLAVLPATGKGTRSAALSADGTRVLIGYTEPPHLTAYDVGSGQALAARDGFCPMERTALNRTGTRALSVRQTNGDGGHTYETVVWDTASGEVLATHASKAEMPSALALDAEGAVAAIGFYTGTLALLDVKTQKILECAKAHTGAVLTVALARDGKKVASSGDDGIVRIGHAQTGALEQLLRGHSKRVLCVKFDPTGRLVASTDLARRFFVWDLKGTKQAIVKLDLPPRMKGPIVPEKTGTRCFAFGDGGPAHLWDARTGNLHPVNPPPDTKIVAFAFDPAGTRFAAADDRGTVHLWDAIGPVAHDLPRLERSKLLREIGGGAKVAVETLAFSADGKRLLVADGWTVAVFDTATREKVFAREFRHAVACLSDDGRHAAASWRSGVSVWDLDSKTVREFDTRGGDWVSSLAIGPKSESLAAGTRDWALFLFDMSAPDAGALATPKAKLEGHVASVRSLAFHPKGHRLASGADDGAIKMWDTASGQESIGVDIFVREPIRSLLFSSNGTELMATPDKHPPFMLHGGVRPLVTPPRK